MSWEEIERLTQQVQQLPAEQQTSQQLSHVMVSAHSTMIEGSRVTVLEAFDFLLGAASTLGPGKPLAGYDMLGDHARALDLALQRADARQLLGPALLRELRRPCGPLAGPLTRPWAPWTPRRATCAGATCSSLAPAPSPNAQKVPALVAAFTGELRERMPGWPPPCASSWSFPLRPNSAWLAFTPSTTATGARRGCS